MTYTIPDFGPNDLMTSTVETHRRVKVDQDDTSYSFGTQFRISFPLIISATPIVIKVVSPIDFELIEQSVETHQGGFAFEAFRDVQGAETGTFDAVVPAYKNNSQTTASEYTGQITLDTGGGFTPSAGQVPVETINVLSASANAQKSTSIVGANGKRGLPAGTYYLRFTRIGSSGDTLGVYALIYNENP
jgi:hypothetical protein